MSLSLQQSNSQNSQSNKIGECFKMKKWNSLEEVLFAVHISCPRETLVSQQRLTVGALEALGVPVAVQHLQDELVEDVLTTARTLGDFWRERETEYTACVKTIISWPWNTARRQVSRTLPRTVYKIRAG